MQHLDAHAAVVLRGPPPARAPEHRGIGQARVAADRAAGHDQLVAGQRPRLGQARHLSRRPGRDVREAQLGDVPAHRIDDATGGQRRSAGRGHARQRGDGAVERAAPPRAAERPVAVRHADAIKEAQVGLAGPQLDLEVAARTHPADPHRAGVIEELEARRLERPVEVGRHRDLVEVGRLARERGRVVEQDHLLAGPGRAGQGVLGVAVDHRAAPRHPATVGQAGAAAVDLEAHLDRRDPQRRGDGVGRHADAGAVGRRRAAAGQRRGGPVARDIRTGSDRGGSDRGRGLLRGEGRRRGRRGGILALARGGGRRRAGGRPGRTGQADDRGEEEAEGASPAGPNGPGCGRVPQGRRGDVQELRARTGALRGSPGAIHRVAPACRTSGVVTSVASGGSRPARACATSIRLLRARERLYSGRVGLPAGDALALRP